MSGWPALRARRRRADPGLRRRPGHPGAQPDLPEERQGDRRPELRPGRPDRTAASTSGDIVISVPRAKGRPPSGTRSAARSRSWPSTASSTSSATTTTPGMEPEEGRCAPHLRRRTERDVRDLDRARPELPGGLRPVAGPHRPRHVLQDLAQPLSGRPRKRPTGRRPRQYEDIRIAFEFLRIILLIAFLVYVLVVCAGPGSRPLGSFSPPPPSPPSSSNLPRLLDSSAGTPSSWPSCRPPLLPRPRRARPRPHPRLVRPRGEGGRGGARGGRRGDRDLPRRGPGGGHHREARGRSPEERRRVRGHDRPRDHDAAGGHGLHPQGRDHREAPGPHHQGKVLPDPRLQGPGRQHRGHGHGQGHPRLLRDEAQGPADRAPHPARSSSSRSR